MREKYSLRSGKRTTGMKLCASLEDDFLVSSSAAGQTALIAAAETIGDLIHKIKGTMPDGRPPKARRMEEIIKCW